MVQGRTLRGEHAVVLGASMGGLLAARALTNHFEHVTLVERDDLPTDAMNRKGVPQGRHTHALLAKGTEVLEAYFPGLRDELSAIGVPSGDVGLRMRMIAGGRRCVPCELGRTGLWASRPLLESYVRRRLFALPGVTTLEQHDALELTQRGGRVTGVMIRARGGASTERFLEADLVVDATGRASKTPDWLRELGFPAPEEDVVRVGISYVTRHFRRRPSDLGGDFGVIISAAPPNRRVCAALAQEDEKWTVTLAGYLGERAPTDLEGFVEFARGLPAPDMHELLEDAEPIGEPLSASYPASVRRRYERLARFPERFVTIADAVCGFNPIFGQGMTVAAVEATLLDETLGKGLDAVGKRFFARATKPLDAPWGITVGNDLRFPEVDGKRTLGVRLINAYMARFLRAAAEDPELSRAFFEVANLTASPEQLMHPRLLPRVFFRQSAARAETPKVVGEIA